MLLGLPERDYISGWPMIFLSINTTEGEITTSKAAIVVPLDKVARIWPPVRLVQSFSEKEDLIGQSPPPPNRICFFT